jgi:hypothetical protein
MFFIDLTLYKRKTENEFFFNLCKKEKRKRKLRFKGGTLKEFLPPPYLEL